MNNKGISVISLVITIIIIVLITSITLYTGIPIITNSNESMAEYRLQAISNAIMAYEKELNYVNSVGSKNNPRLISSADYKIMGLDEYSDVENVPATYIYKEVSGDFQTFYLTTYKTVKVNYDEKDEVTYSFNYKEDLIKRNYKVEFDEVKGVNRPLICDGMQPVILEFKDSYYQVKSIRDIYDEDWYDYNSSSPMWANVIVKSQGEDLHNKYMYYVWIPRFAYKISNFDVNTDYNNIPASSIQIIFLRGTTDYMKNGEVLPSGYQVHPAFKYKENGEEVNISGFWINKENVGGGAEVLFRRTGDSSKYLGAIEQSELSKIHPDMVNSDATKQEVDSHLIKNTEWAAMAYLSHSTVGNVADGSSLGEWNASGVFYLDSLQYVAAECVPTTNNKEPNTSNKKLPYGDNYYYIKVNTSSGEKLELMYESYEKDSMKYGDAMLATSTGLNATSSWFGGSSIKPSAPPSDYVFIMRGYDKNLFAYNAIERNPFGGGAFRNVLTVRDR